MLFFLTVRCQEQKASSFTNTVERTTTVCPELLWAFGILLVGMVMGAQGVEHHEVTFSDLSIALGWCKRLAQ